ncbi:MAG TPA: hypothetical protein EYP17_02695 [Candidatus Latescibacteria bacterium]|nr:hypothetical protein [Candidatus Latescibacterota bacterium]
MAEEAKVAVPELERAEIPWVVAYLKEDIQDLRNEVREVRRSVERLDAKIVPTDGAGVGFAPAVGGLPNLSGRRWRSR